LDDGRVGGGIVMRCCERADGPDVHRKRLDGGNDVGLQLEDLWRRFCRSGSCFNAAWSFYVRLELLSTACRCWPTTCV